MNLRGTSRDWRSSQVSRLWQFCLLDGVLGGQALMRVSLQVPGPGDSAHTLCAMVGTHEPGPLEAFRSWGHGLVLGA